MATTEERITALEQQVTALRTALGSIEPCKCNLEDYLKKSDADATYQTKEDGAVSIQLLGDAVNQLSKAVTNNEQKIGTLPEDTTATTVVEYVDEKTASAGGSAAPEYKLPFTASEVAGKLGKIE